MRVFAGSIIVLLAVALTAFTQQPPETVDSVLRGWEKAMTDLKSFVAVVERSTFDKALKTNDEFDGYAMFFKGSPKDPSRARLELAKMERLPNKTKKRVDSVFEKYICTGTFLYEYVPSTSTIRVHEMPKNEKEGLQESFLSFLFGMSAVDAQKRYDMVLVYPEDKDKKSVRDPNYHYLLIRPKTEKDRSDFIEARLSLLRSNNLPAQIWYLQPNKNEVTWSFKDMQVNVQIPPKYFQPDDLKGWKTDHVKPALPPALKK